MEDSRLLFYSLVLGLALSIFWGMAAWLKWQQMKSGTIIPAGSFTVSQGRNVGNIINVVCIGIAFCFAPQLGWWLILSLASCSFIGGWIATIAERRLYCNQFQLDTIVFAAQEYSKDSGTEGAAEILSMVAPKWWIKLMPSYWREELNAKLRAILLPDSHDSGNT